MPTLDWIGKRAVVNHHRELPYRLLHCDREASAGEPGGGNLLVEGDNLHALKALLPYYAGKVKCIYIDPPYNTGNEGWVYNDNVNAPEIQKWLGDTVGKEAEDLSRHDKWLCMMYPRLALLRDFLREDGVVFVSLDDNELSSLRYVMDELFGEANFVGLIVWRNVTDNNPTRISVEHEYVVCYARKKEVCEAVWKTSALPIKDRLIALAEELKASFPDLEERQAAYTRWFRENKAYMWPFDRYKFIDDGGIFTGSQSVHNPGKEGYRYDVMHPETGKPCQEPLMGYRFPKSTMEGLLATDRILFGADDRKIIELKLYVQDYKAKLPSVLEMDTRLGANELRMIFPEEKRIFGFSKPSAFISELLSFVTKGDDLVLDSFAGSGTTGHAILALNKEDGASRRFILAQMPFESDEQKQANKNIASGITAARLKRVIKGYGETPGLGGSFRYCTLGEPLFDAEGRLQEDVKWADLAHHLWFAETGEPWSPAHLLPNETQSLSTGGPLIGITSDGRAIYLLYSSLLQGGRRNGATTLSSETVASLAKHDGPRVVYADACTLRASARSRERIAFKQIPYLIPQQ